VAIGLAGAYGVLLLLFRGKLVATTGCTGYAPSSHAPNPRLLWRSLPGIALTIAGYLLGYPVGGTAMAGAFLSLLLWRRDASEEFGGVNWPLLALFAGLFIVMHGVSTSAPLERLDSLLQGLFSGGPLSYLHLSWVTFLGSQVLSNVPFVLLARAWASHFGGASLFWYTLGFVSTVAGCLTPAGSVVNLIALEEARKRGLDIGFREFVRRGIPLTLAALLPGVASLLLFHR
jgi:Na+/H+ antiporter NhaD/arsenite permease-like protein